MQRVKVGAAAALLLLAGAAWRGPAAHTTTPDHGITAPPAATQTGPRRESYADVVNAVAPSVVTVRTEARARVAPTGGDEDLWRFFGEPFGPVPRSPRTFRQRGVGSGIVMSPDGYILTNHHVVDQAADIRVEFTNGRSVKATVVGSDRPSDLALLKIEATGLAPIPLGDSDQVKVGDVVLAVGNPLNVGQTVTMGIISAKGRSTGVGAGVYEDFLQTDAPINHGSSGGALVNTKGELIGINAQIVSPSDGNVGIGFAIPVNMARHVMDELRLGGHVRRARLGVSVQPVTSEIADSLGLKDVGGAIVNSVEAASAADRAGVRRGDVITSFNGKPVHGTNSLRNSVAESTPGTAATLVVIRDGRQMSLGVKLDEADHPGATRRSDEPDDDKTRLGVAVAPLTPELAVRQGLAREARGMLVQEVRPDSRADDAGILPGDVILEVNRQSVGTVEELRSAMRRSSERPALVLISRGGRELFVTVRA
jgi:Do/DeqQ family serine protease